MAIKLGPDWQNAFWTSPYRLRFELCSGDAYVNMFASAFDRARVLARAALPGEQVTAIVAAFPNPEAELSAKWRGWSKKSGFKILDAMGVPTKSADAKWNGYWWAEDADDPEQNPWKTRAVTVPWDKADILLWSDIAYEIGVGPAAPIRSKLADLTRGVVVNAYDDRGMDIIALKRETICELYTRFDGWLLDYDRPRMAEAFGAGA